MSVEGLGFFWGGGGGGVYLFYLFVCLLVGFVMVVVCLTR